VFLPVVFLEGEIAFELIFSKYHQIVLSLLAKYPYNLKKIATKTQRHKEK
jgi:hypothetical protein